MFDTADPVPRMLAGPPDPIRSLRLPHWVGISALAGGIVLAAIVIPPQLSPAVEQPPERPLGQTAPAGTESPTTGYVPDGAPGVVPETGAPAPESTGSARPDPRPTAPTATPGRPAAPDEGRSEAPRPTPTRTSGPTPSSRSITVQAEDPGNVLGGGAKVASCPSCDGGARVRYLGTLTVNFTNPTAGGRTIAVTYQTDGDRQLKISVNDAAPTTHAVSGAGWDVPRTFRYDAELPAGRTSLTFFNDTGPPPDIDKITIS
ncbi:hypothetical protein GCM10012279_50750 [Micromonospora yangpuensis]|nr:hypothetical protein GCM10012279_50750 [Micromonospora yangpuensis]